MAKLPTHSSRNSNATKASCDVAATDTSRILASVAVLLVLVLLILSSTVSSLVWFVSMPDEFVAEISMSVTFGESTSAYEQKRTLFM